jgi:hypothetical protein
MKPRTFYQLSTITSYALRRAQLAIGTKYFNPWMSYARKGTEEMKKSLNKGGLG